MNQLELDYITIQGFKSLRSVNKLSLGPINIVIGANGSGKSNLIESFSFLHAIREGHLQDYIGRSGGAENILHFGAKTTPVLTITVSFQNEKNQYKIQLTGTEDDSLFPSSEYAFFWDKKHATPYRTALYPANRGREAGICDSSQTRRGIANWIWLRLGRWRLYHFHDTSFTSPMKKASDINDNHYLRPDASNLASFLFFLKHRHPESYSMIRRTVQRVAPFFEDFQLEPTQLHPDKVRLEWKHKGSERYFNASSFSDGTLRFIALATLFLQPAGLLPSVILVDEPELGLHPSAITLLASLMKISAQSAQVIVSTQSSLLLDNFDPEHVLVANREDGSTQFTRLDPPGLEAWLQDYSLGQLWEKNEIGGRPNRE